MVTELRLDVRASSGTNDHETRIIVHGGDWLGPERLGLDPPGLKRDLADPETTTLLVGRCQCGTIGCDDTTVQMRREDSEVRWVCEDGAEIAFDAAQYDAEISRFVSDNSWEDVGRRVERLLTAFFAGTVLGDGKRFEWASTRISRGTVTLSYGLPASDGSYSQRLLEFGWDTKSHEDALAAARRFYRDEFSQNA